jgi:DNA repair exonuclease SbcCD ATPase subunit
MDLYKLERILQKLTNTQEILESDVVGMKKDRDAKIQRIQDNVAAKEVLKKIELQQQQAIADKVSELVTSALRTILGERYSFKVLFKSQKNKILCDFVIQRDDGLTIDPMSAAGGGVVDLISFALRIVALLMSGINRNVLILDEPFRFLDKNKQEVAASLVRNLSETLNIQFIIITHEKSIIQAGSKIFNVTQKNGISQIEKYLDS